MAHARAGVGDEVAAPAQVAVDQSVDLAPRPQAAMKRFHTTGKAARHAAGAPEGVWSEVKQQRSEVRAQQLVLRPLRLLLPRLLLA